MNQVLQCILVIIIFIVIFVVIKDYKEKYKTCDPEDLSIKGIPGPKGDPGTDLTTEIKNAKKELIIKFINNLKFEQGKYIIGSQQLGCD